MRVWLYGRLSSDDDILMNSIQNQEKICREYAASQGYSIVGQSADNGVSGMKFSRRGLEQFLAAVEAGQVDALIVKDLSRLGRHKIQTALLIDELRRQGIAVISATENLNTLRDEDDLLISLRGVMNDFYARDISRKVRSGYRQKQREGLVMIPPFGYWKDKNTNTIRILPEAADTVTEIYRLYLSGCGQKEIARRLNQDGRATPAQLQRERYGKIRSDIRTYLWTYQSIKNILSDESYTGVMVNHKREWKDGTSRDIPEEGRFRHEGVFPVLIEKEQWNRVQSLLRQRKRCAHSNRRKHRYAGLLCCKECGNPFVPMIRYWNGTGRVEYICKGYQRYGKDFCASHRIHEEVVDKKVWQFLLNLQNQLRSRKQETTRLQKLWALKKPKLEAKQKALGDEIALLEGEIDEILMEKIGMDSKGH